MYQVSDSDMRELRDAEAAVTGLRREAETSEGRITMIRSQLRSAETQLSNVVRRILAGADGPDLPPV